MNQPTRGATPNVGGRAQSHLANERTYLAWLRTGLSMAALGVAVVKFAPARGHAAISGSILIFAGLLASGYGAARYRLVARDLEAGVFAPARFGLVTITAVLVLLFLIAVLLLG